MKILLTGATGYIGKRILPSLVEKGYSIVCCVREKERFSLNSEWSDKVDVIEVDFLKKETLGRIPADIDTAYYLIHSMSAGSDKFSELESRSALNFREAVDLYGSGNDSEALFLLALFYYIYFVHARREPG